MASYLIWGIGSVRSIYTYYLAWCAAYLAVSLHDIIYTFYFTNTDTESGAPFPTPHMLSFNSSMCLLNHHTALPFKYL